MFATSYEFSLFERGNEMRKDAEGKGKVPKELENELDLKVKRGKQ